jgi:hypothetical protein
MPEENRPISAEKSPECHESGGVSGGISAARRENFQVPDPPGGGADLRRRAARLAGCAGKSQKKRA